MQVNQHNVLRHLSYERLAGARVLDPEVEVEVVEDILAKEVHEGRIQTPNLQIKHMTSQTVIRKMNKKE